MKAEDIRPSHLNPYDPQYDPLIARNPGHGAGYAPTYWVGTAGRPPDDDGPVCGDMEADVVIVGSGFTGLSTALFLAREHGIQEIVPQGKVVRLAPLSWLGIARRLSHSSRTPSPHSNSSRRWVDASGWGALSCKLMP